MSRHEISPLFLVCITLCYLLSPLEIHPVQSSFSWLKKGSYAVYSFGINKTPANPWLCLIGFDDCALADDVLGFYSWQCVDVGGQFAKIEVEINLTSDRGVNYWGKNFFEMAEKGDFSFIRRIPQENIAQKLILPSSNSSVKIMGPINIHTKINVTMNLDTLELIDETGKPWGKWTMWINTLKYPLVGTTEEMFVMNWLNTTLYLNVLYKNESSGISIDTVLGKFERFFAAGHRPFENEFLLNFNTGATIIILTYCYEPRSGIFLKTAADFYLDDILTQRLGIVYADGYFALQETNISIDQTEGGFDLSTYLPYLTIAGIAAMIITIYFIKRKNFISK